MATESVKCSCVWLLLWLCVRLSQTTNTRASMDDDILLPYTEGHGPSHSHRYVRDCQAIIHGNTTYESWPSSNHSGQPVAETKWFVSDVPKSSRVVYGHMTVVNDPLRTVSVLEPGGPGGCEMRLRTTVQETAEAAMCLYAQNAGFFNTTTRQCLGNVVSNGKVVQDSGGLQNAQFGIRKDGSLVFGYLSQDDVLDQSNPFVQLVSGVVWLLRNGEIYISESMEAECNKTQETGDFRTFVDVVSARTAVGHDAEGRLILFHFEGQTRARGLNLWEMADYLKKHGVINAINLDGGGSATYINNGILASYPSDHCTSDNMWRCERPVSTILCIHKRRCQPANCSEHGDCVDGHCQCHDGWRGAACDSCQPSACGPHGIRIANGCVCDAGWRGKNCSQECLAGFYGDGCNQTCSCVNGGSCDPVHGHCTCPPGFHGNSCDQVCPLGFYGLSCAQECHCEDLCPCDPQTGSCNTTLPGHISYTLHTESRCRNSSVFVAVCPNRGAPCQLIWEDWKCYSPASGHCLARKMFTFWKQEDAHRGRPYLTERTWLIITLTLAAFLSASLLVHLVQACRAVSVASHFPKRRDYSYVPLSNINRVTSCATDDTGRAEKGAFQLEDSDSQDEIWSSSHSGQP